MQAMPQTIRIIEQISRKIGAPFIVNTLSASSPSDFL
jgi:hypothetical protein